MEGKDVQESQPGECMHCAIVAAITEGPDSNQSENKVSKHTQIIAVADAKCQTKCSTNVALKLEMTTYMLTDCFQRYLHTRTRNEKI